MFDKILYPTDFSDVARKALGCIGQLKHGSGAMVVVLHVVDQRGLQAVEQYSSANAQQLELEIMGAAEKELETVANELEQYGYRVKTRLEVGMPVREILRVEEEEDVSIIVLGSHGKSNIQEMFLGSVSEKVARKCRKPVLIVKR